MKRYHLRRLMCLSFFLAFMLMGITYMLDFQPFIVIVIGVLLFIGAFIIDVILGFCPKCKDYSSAMVFGEYCPHCGEKLD